METNNRITQGVLRIPKRRSAATIVLLFCIYIAAYAVMRASGLVYLHDGKLDRRENKELRVVGDLVYPSQSESPLPPALLSPIRFIFGPAGSVEGWLRPMGLVRAPALAAWCLLLWPLLVRRPSAVKAQIFLALIAGSFVVAAILLTAALLEGDPGMPLPTVVEPGLPGPHPR